ncbi:hypothetical protein AB0C34_17945 [Nocardia sp. NPDC049220]|uniref:hypothetical protein n=1 Tax=Nocardia sp. NPDC049220 TaxID=3155273 RepID=UPI00340D297C
MKVERKRRPGRPEREDGPDYRTVGARIPDSLAQLVKGPVDTPAFPTLKARVVKLLQDGLAARAKASRRLGVVRPGKRTYIGPVDLPKPLDGEIDYAGKRTYIGPVDLPKRLGDEIDALVENGTFPTITTCLIELLLYGLALEPKQSVEYSFQMELPLAPTGT